MSFPNYLIYNANAYYPVEYQNNSLSKEPFIHQQITVSPSKSFDYNTIDLFPAKGSPRTFTSYSQVTDYIKNATMDNWKNQFKFALYCATSACGVSWHNHINHTIPLVRSIFRFHVYFTVRKVLHQLQIPLPGNPDFNSEKNPYNKQAYEQLKLEFNFSPDFNYFHLGKVKALDITMNGTHYLQNPHRFPFNADKHGYVYADHARLYIDKLYCINSDDWTNFIALDGKGLTQAGISRINESIRTYVYCILGAQTMIRRDIIDSFDAQKQFELLVEDAVQGQTLVDSVKTFQTASLLIRSKQSYSDTLKNTGKRLDFAIAPGLQLIPSNMRLHIGIIEGYNNSLLTATENMTFGVNHDINLRKKRDTYSTDMTETATTALTNALEKTEIKNKTSKDVPLQNEKKFLENNHMAFTIGLVIVGSLIELFI